jgi:origin recognition complex subunit 6
VEDLVERERAKAQREGDGDQEAERGEQVVGQIGRPDSMFQERYDYLGERKRKAYAEWKQVMLKRIRELEA